jgi:hypothetical protein
MFKAFNICTSDHLILSQQLQAAILEHCGVQLEIVQCDLPSGDFMTSHFYDVVKFKIQTLLKNLEDNSCSMVAYFDSDIVIRGDAVSAMCKSIGEHDICFQSDRGSFCSGMFIAKNNNKIVSFFTEVLHRLDHLREKYVHTSADQTVINEMLKTEEIDLNFGFLDDSFTTYGNINTEVRLWEGEEFLLEDNVVAFHANFTIGTQSKLQLMDYVKSLSK